jgi:hypothetical protein
MRINTLSTAWLIATGVFTQTIKLNVPDAPPPGTQVLTGSFQGYSMEVASFANIAGNLTYVLPIHARSLSH